MILHEEFVLVLRNNLQSLLLIGIIYLISFERCYLLPCSSIDIVQGFHSKLSLKYTFGKSRARRGGLLGKRTFTNHPLKSVTEVEIPLKYF